MVDPMPHPEARASLRLHDAARCLAKRSQFASGALVLVLVAASVFAVWSSQATSIAASRAVAANDLSDHYAQASSAVAAQESLERKYRLEPGPGIRTSFQAAATGLVAALGHVRQDGDAGDRVFVDRILAQNGEYLAGVAQIFAAVDRDDIVTTLRVDGEIELVLERMQEVMVGAAADKRRTALAELARLQQLETFNRLLTPVVFLGGLGLATMLASITRGHRRLLDVERAHAVHDSLHDALTGLPNRKLLAERFSQALLTDAQQGTSTGLLLIDLDRFKDINDTFGHHYGDELLAKVGDRLSAGVRESDTVARLGGDEFAVLLPDMHSLDSATAVAAALQAALEAPFQVEDMHLDVEASIGVVLSGKHGRDTTTLLQRADIAMYVAKAQNLGVFAYEPGADGHTPTKLALLGDLRRALERGELILHYQPKLSISTGDVVGVEALVRWQHPQRGVVFPDEFIPLAEHTGLIGPLTRRVLDMALAQARLWSDAGRPLTVSVNLSVRNLLDERFPGQVAGLLRVHGVSARLLNLEVTETAIMTEPVRAQHLLEQLSCLGIGISIDDFGAGYTSLGQLKNMPIDELKVDRSFVMTMVEDPSNTLIVRSVIDLGHNLGFTLVAEGVETEQILVALADLGCDVAQGYHLSCALTAAAFDTWCAGRHIAPVCFSDGVSHEPANSVASVDF